MVKIYYTWQAEGQKSTQRNKNHINIIIYMSFVGLYVLRDVPSAARSSGDMWWSFSFPEEFPEELFNIKINFITEAKVHNIWILNDRNDIIVQ